MSPRENQPGRKTTTVSDPAPHYLFKPLHRSIVRKGSMWVALPLAAIALLPAYQKLADWYVGPVFAIAILAACLLLIFGLIWIVVVVSRRTTTLAIQGDRLVYHSWG